MTDLADMIERLEERRELERLREENTRLRAAVESLRPDAERWRLQAMRMEEQRMWSMWLMQSTNQPYGSLHRGAMNAPYAARSLNDLMAGIGL